MKPVTDMPRAEFENHVRSEKARIQKNIWEHNADVDHWNRMNPDKEPLPRITNEWIKAEMAKRAEAEKG